MDGKGEVMTREELAEFMRDEDDEDEHDPWMDI